MRNEIKAILLLVLLLVFLAGNLAFLMAFRSSITGKAVENKYTFTKAICNSDNYCEDYNISCSNGNLEFMKPTGNAVQFQEDFVDNRSQEERERLC